MENGDWTTSDKQSTRTKFGYCMECQGQPVLLYDIKNYWALRRTSARSIDGECSNGICYLCHPEKDPKIKTILDEIDKVDIDSIELHPDAVEYLETLQSYLQCFDKLGELYSELDPDRILAKYHMHRHSIASSAIVFEWGTSSELGRTLRSGRINASGLCHQD